MSLISDMSAALIAAGYATAEGTDLFAILFPPASQINCLCIIPLAGRVPVEVMGGAGIDYPGVQIQVRNSDLQTAIETAEAIRLAFTKTTQGEYTLYATRSHPVNLTNPDDIKAGQYRFSVDFETICPR